MKQTFSESNICVTLTGEEWFAVIARMTGQPLSKKGNTLYQAAVRKLTKQILTASERLK